MVAYGCAERFLELNASGANESVAARSGLPLATIFNLTGLISPSTTERKRIDDLMLRLVWGGRGRKSLGEPG